LPFPEPVDHLQDRRPRVLVDGAGHLLLDESTQARTEIQDFLS
jgi:hypothetical protein